MTIQDVFDRLIPIEKTAGELNTDTGYDPDDGIGGKVRHTWLQRTVRSVYIS
ncbi:MAG: hypothetical protein LIO75_02920 [Lachnospiraceae bacterium]|nr:hypothetical protein [Lachnospiraceae bacterium]